MSLPSSMADFVPCDRLLQKAYLFTSLKYKEWTEWVHRYKRPLHGKL